MHVGRGGERAVFGFAVGILLGGYLAKFCWRSISHVEDKPASRLVCQYQCGIIFTEHLR